MYCRTCGRQLDDQARICPGCGVPPKKCKKYCPNCGKPTGDDAKECESCGVSLAGDSSPDCCCVGVILCVAFIIGAVLISTCGPLLFGIIPISGLMWALIRALNKPK